MPIDQIHENRMLEWLREKGVRDDCPACGCEGKWMVGDVIAPPAAPGGGGTVIGGPSFPLVQIVCEHCAYVMHFAGTRSLSFEDLRSHYMEGTDG